MKHLFTILIILALSVSCIALKNVEVNKPDLSIYEHDQTKEVVELVYKAVEQIATYGETVFPDFRKKDSSWFYGENYVFVWGLDGMRFVYPPNTSAEGKNMLSLEDIKGKPIGKMFVNTAKTGEGWVFYEWTLPDTNLIEWKSTFIKKVTAPSGTEYLVGSGKYKMPMEKVFVENIVNAAAELLKTEGEEKAFTRFNNRADKFIYLNSYIFVKTMEGIELVNPFSPQLVGKDMSNKQDAAGKYFTRDEQEILKTKDTCWMDYMWNKPGSTNPSQKRSYLKKVVVGDKTLIVGSGYYPE